MGVNQENWVLLAVVIWLAFIINGFMWPTWRVTHPKLLSVLSVSFFVCVRAEVDLAGFEVAGIGAKWVGLGSKSVDAILESISRKTFLTQTGVALLERLS